MLGSAAVASRAALALAGLVLTASAHLAGTAQAQQAYPARPLRCVVAFGPGGVGDTTSRLVAEGLSKRLGQRVVVENVPGGGGIAAALSGPADGYTLALLANGASISVSLFKSLPFDPIADYAPVSKPGFFEFFIAVKSGSRFAKLADLVKEARDNPGKLNIGTINPGSTQHLSAMLLKSTAGIEFQWVPFKSIVARLSKAAAETLVDADLRERLLDMGINGDPTTPEALVAHFEGDIARTADGIAKAKTERR